MRPVDRELPRPERTEAFDHDASAPRDRPGRCRDTSAARRAAGTARRRARSRLPWRPPAWRTRPCANSSGKRSSRAPASASTRAASLTSTSITARSPSSFRPVEVSALRSHDQHFGFVDDPRRPARLDRPLAVVQQRLVAVRQHGQAEGGARLHQICSRCRRNASCALILPITRSRFISSTVPAATQT